MTAQRNILIINYASESVLGAINELRVQGKEPELGAIVLTNQPDNYGKTVQDWLMSIRIHVVHSQFDSPEIIANELGDLKETIVGVVCRGDKHIQYLKQVVPILPDTALAPSVESLNKSTNKKQMRQAFLEKYPEITPNYVQINDASDKSIEKIERLLSYPVIVKPANLASSLLIQSCYEQKSLKLALDHIFSYVDAIYKKEGRRESPEIIVEEFLEGTYYSIDAYVGKYNQITCCPPVLYIPAKQLGIDDFFIYKRSMPSGLDDDAISEANEVVAKAIRAVGLEYSSAHVELIQTKNGWKIIELGPRLGRFRDQMYKISYNINHALNDISTRLGYAPIVSTKLLKYCIGYSIYPFKEGRLKQLSGIEMLQETKGITGLRIFCEPNDYCYFAKHGGHTLAEFLLESNSEEYFNKTVALIDKTVRADIE